MSIDPRVEVLRTLEGRADIRDAHIAHAAKVGEHRRNAQTGQLPREGHAVRQLIVRIPCDRDRRLNELQGGARFADRQPDALMELHVAQKRLISAKRTPGARAKDILYIHDTLSLFARSLAELHDIWSDGVSGAIGARTAAQVRRNRDRLFTDVTDAIRQAVTMAPGRALTPDGVLEVCQQGLGRVLSG